MRFSFLFVREFAERVCALRSSLELNGCVVFGRESARRGRSAGRSAPRFQPDGERGRVCTSRQAGKVPVIAHCLTILRLIVFIRLWGVHPTEQERHESERDVSIVPGWAGAVALPVPPEYLTRLKYLQIHFPNRAAPTSQRGTESVGCREAAADRDAVIG